MLDASALYILKLFKKNQHEVERIMNYWKSMPIEKSFLFFELLKIN
jgi:hypothetical protein